MGKMRVRCQNCSTRFVVDDTHGGLWGVCSICRARTMLPIPDPRVLLTWAWQTSYERLARFIRYEGARGHDRQTIDELIRIAEQRRWQTEECVRHKLAKQREERRKQAADSQLLTLDSLRALSPARFEQFVAELFCKQGYDAVAVGGAADRGVDVLIRQSGELWGIAQCKRYSSQVRVGPTHLRDFGGAFLLSKVSQGFFFTTGTLTRHAKSTARGFPWLTVYAGPELVRFAQDVQASCGERFRSIADAF